jgi:uncharacterized protein YndB with AHSA1/START domain
MNDPSRTTVRVSRRFHAAPDRVFDAWLDPASARQWMFATPGGEMRRVDIDARAGGRFEVIEKRGAEEAQHCGTYVEVDRPRRLVFDFAVPQFSRETTRVTVMIDPRDGGCELALTHDGVLADYAERTAAGWNTMLDGLARTLGDDDRILGDSRQA